jgi:hypothetical protein
VIGSTTGGGAFTTRTFSVALTEVPATPTLITPLVPGFACGPGVMTRPELPLLAIETPGGCLAQLEVKSTWPSVAGLSTHTWHSVAMSSLSGAPPCTALNVPVGQRNTGCGLPICTGTATIAFCARGSDRLVPSLTSKIAAAGPW